MYLAELKHFLACVANKEEVIADGISGKRVLELILAARESSETGNIVVL
jgi:predicted dehydrogenase